MFFFFAYNWFDVTNPGFLIHEGFMEQVLILITELIDIY